MQDSRYGKHMNWDYNKKMDKDEKFKCWSECEKHEKKHDKCHHRKHEKVFIDVDVDVDVEVEVDVDVEVKKRCKKKEKDYGHKDDYYYEDEKCSYKDEKSDKHRCKGCACNFLKRLEPGTLVDVFLSGGGSFLSLTFINLDPKSCCAYFLELEVAAAATPVVIDCQKIDAIRRTE